MADQKQLNEFLNHLLKQGLRVTEQRKALLNFALSFGRPFSAIEMYQQMDAKFHGLSYGTVYQNLKLFSELRMIEAFAMANEVRYRVIDRTQPQLHFICMDCESTIHVDFNPNQSDLPTPQSFKSVNYKLDVFGYCVDCSSQKKQTST